jgi:hypothetical protein
VSITSVGTPSTPTQVTSGTGTVTVAGAWSGTQPRAAGDLLVALVTCFGSTSAAATAQASGTTGWTKLREWGAATSCCTSIWTKPAAGSDAAPSFTSSIAGTSARTRLACGLWQLNDSGGSTPVVDVQNSGAGTGTSGTLTVSTVGSVAASGEYALACETATNGSNTAGTNTWGTSGSFTNSFSDAASANSHWVMAILAGPASGSALSYAPTHTITSTNESGIIAVFKPGLVAKSGADTASGADAGSVTRESFSSADSGQAREAGYGFGGDWVHATESGVAVPAGVAKSSADSASGADLPKPVTVKPPGEAPHGLDAGSVHAAVPGTDSGHAAEGTPAVRFTAPDTGHGTEAASVHAALSKADTGHAAEGSPPSVRLSGTESAHGTEGVTSLHATLAQADTGHGSDAPAAIRPAGAADTGHGLDAGSIHATVPGSDTAHGTEGSPARIRVSGTDSGHGTEGVPVIRLPVAADSAHAAESGTVPGSPSGADTGHAAEAASVHATLSGADTGHAAEAAVLTEKFSSADSAHAAEGTPAVRFPGPDAGHGTEGSSVHAALAKGDAGHGAEGVPAVRLAGIDTGHGTEAAIVHATQPGADSGHLAEGTPSVRLAKADTAHGADLGSVSARVTGTDSAHAAESGSSSARVPGSDSGHAAEAASIHVTLASSDSAHAAEFGSTGHTVRGADTVLAVESAFYYITGADSGHAAEGFAVRASSPDRAAAADRPLNSWPSAHDAAQKAAERAWWSGPLAAADGGHAAEGWKPFPFSSSDSGHAVEVLHEMGIWTYIPVNVRLLGRFWRVTGTDEQGNEVVLLEAERLSGDLLTLAEKVALGTARRVSSGDCSGSAERVSRQPVAVTCWVQPAAAVSVSVSAVRVLSPAPAGKG